MEAEFIWTRSEALTFTNRKCALCAGGGAMLTAMQRAEAELARLGFGGTTTLKRPSDENANEAWLKREVRPCDCALIGAFEACLSKYREIQDGGQFERTYARVEGGSAIGVLGYPLQEYCADFELIARRTLAPQAFQEFRRSLHGRPLSRGIQVQLGRAYRETKPYPLYPFHEYFGVS